MPLCMYTHIVALKTSTEKGGAMSHNSEKLPYEKPTVEVLSFESTDVICSSNLDDDGWTDL